MEDTELNSIKPSTTSNCPVLKSEMLMNTSGCPMLQPEKLTIQRDWPVLKSEKLTIVSDWPKLRHENLRITSDFPIPNVFNAMLEGQQIKSEKSDSFIDNVQQEQSERTFVKTEPTGHTLSGNQRHAREEKLDIYLHHVDNGPAKHRFATKTELPYNYGQGVRIKRLDAAASREQRDLDEYNFVFETGPECVTHNCATVPPPVAKEVECVTTGAFSKTEMSWSDDTAGCSCCACVNCTTYGNGNYRTGGQNPKKCKLYPQKGDSTQNLLNNIIRDAELQGHPFETCHKLFADPSDNITHKQRPKHNVRDVCGKESTVASEMTVHKQPQNGGRLYVCDVCGKGFPKSGKLTVHKRSHTKETPFVCNLCGKGFTQSGNHTRHRRAHTGGSPYVCSLCGKGFTQSDSLTAHRLAHA